jgi:hypothetical protein
LIFDPLVQTCIFDDWPVQDVRRRLCSAESSSNRQECSAEIMEELKQLKATQRAHAEDMAEVKAMLRALSSAKDINES